MERKEGKRENSPRTGATQTREDGRKGKRNKGCVDADNGRRRCAVIKHIGERRNKTETRRKNIRREC